MPDELKPGETPPANEGGKGEEQTPKTPKDLNEAIQLLAERDAHIKQLNAESATRRKALKQFEDDAAKRAEEEKKRRDAELSEVERLKQQFAESENARKQSAQEIADLRLRQAIEREATRLDFVNPDEAYLLADMTGVEKDDQGNLKGVKEAIEKLAKARPHLLKVKTPGIGTPRGSAGKPTGKDEKPKNVLGIRL